MTTTKRNRTTPDGAAGMNGVGTNSTPTFGDKRAVAAMAGMRSVRWVDNMVAAGMPHLKLGTRRVRFDLDEVRQWLKERYGTQRVAA